MAIHESGEMYLETILILSNRMDKVRSIDVAHEMDFSKPSVSRAMSILKNNNFITIDDNGYITLTKEGSAIANKIYERHDVLTKALQFLGVDAEIAAEDACKIEHDISDASFAAIKKYVKNTK
ncbi:MAG: metal-dependent transcriptional regulator [Lachnospiraceae bacterium]|nr:metal-dependent transcriptional regulator [Lachnospiraceae bacterium]